MGHNHMTGKEEYVYRMETELLQFAHGIDTLESRAANLNGRRGDRFRARIEDVKNKHAAAKRRLDELSTARESIWTEMKGGLEMALKVLHYAYERAASQVGPEEQGGTAVAGSSIEANWMQLKGKVKQRWGELTDDDVEVIEGKRDRLIGKIQEKYGISREEAEEQVEKFSMTP